MTERTSRGFGMVELMIAIALIAILAAISIPSFERFFSAGRLEGALQEINAVFNLARTSAIARGKAVSVLVRSGDKWCVAAGIPNAQSTSEDSTDNTATPACSCSPDCSSCTNCEVIGVAKAQDHEKVMLTSPLQSYLIDPSNGITTATGTIEVLTAAHTGHISLNKLGKAWICDKKKSSC